ncbi:penicillin acylase family protein [Fibrisoma montanum]|uniref:Penicillin acylase family protein n=1 Tax=Fibrisoma montanum TaxID=2305895 RepID=A0A418LYT7_9BACT|nr:penicillin acylase family protein [Fibrisoma montanum]RIV18524.1 penicillin acylase family protein [Fibrisoma montanum]
MIRLLLLTCLLVTTPLLAQRTPGLKQPVEIIRDRWGIAHIYARNEHDLFFAQGYSAASDRLFQLEIWRRQATGTVAELLGPKEVKRDMGTRLFRFRGNLDQELKHYHPHGPQIVQAFVDGINAYIREILKTPEKLPIEFRLLNTKPGYWTPEVVISRHQGLLGNVRDELNYGRLVHLIGADKLRQLQWFHPARKATEPDLTLHVSGADLMQPILEIYEAFRLPLKFSATDEGPGATEEEAGLNRQQQIADWFDTEKQYVGSNNWIISGKRSASGFPMLANDPHRAQSVPSLRYWVHLSAPGWNVVGAGEPTLPGVSIGHNDYGAWGLTIFETDNEDLYVYETNPANPNQYRYQGRWKDMRVLTETIPVKGRKPATATLKYTHHGPVVFEDAKNYKAYAVRAGWLDRGCAPYLASLRMNQARNWTEFRQACAYSRLPGENMIWAGRPSAGKNTIGWQATGLSPIRKNWTGLVPVPGDGRFEWSGYLPIQQLPHKIDPPEGFVVTANNNLTPADFPHRNAVGWVWANPVRADRIKEVIQSKPRHSIDDFKALQADYLSMSARSLVPLLKNLKANDPVVEQSRQRLLNWDYQLRPESVPAAIYVAWETELRQAVYSATVPEVARPYLRSVPMKRVVDWLTHNEVPPGLLTKALEKAVATLTQRLGPDPSLWLYGQPNNKHITLTHTLSSRATPEQRAKMNLGPLPRGGYGETVNNTGNGLNQEHGASFRIIVDTQDWDKTVGINSPGQSGDPASPHYADLFPLWAQNGYFPVYFSKKKVQSVAESTISLQPSGTGQINSPAGRRK